MHSQAHASHTPTATSGILACLSHARNYLPSTNHLSFNAIPINMYLNIVRVVIWRSHRGVFGGNRWLGRGRLYSRNKLRSKLLPASYHACRLLKSHNVVVSWWSVVRGLWAVCRGPWVVVRGSWSVGGSGREWEGMPLRRALLCP